MRDAIREHLLANVTGINDIYEPHAAGVNAEFPYLVIRQGVDTEESEWAGFRRIIEIWPYLSRTTFSKVDDLADQIINALAEQLITDSTTGEVFSCIYLGSIGEDFYDNEWEGITRGLRFAVIALQPVSINETVASDSWIRHSI
nr:hypothetical protein 3 [Bacillales bacterium]